MLKIKLKRVYAQPDLSDGYRVLVDRLWPRGISKELEDWDEWAKDLAPSAELRKWFHHDALLWDEFSEKYLQELQQSNLGKDFVERMKDKKIITLIYAAKDEEHCHARILKEFLSKFI